MIGESCFQEQFDKAFTHAEKSQEKEIDAGGEPLAKELGALPA